MSKETQSKAQRGLDLSFATSFMTTLIVAVAPTFVAFGFLVWSRPDPHPFLAILASVLLTGAAFGVGSKIWENQPESFGYSFADLMLWHWVRREWAEEKLVRNARVLGYDRQGRFIGKNDISPERQLAAARAIGSALDAKSSYTIEHSKRVEKHARDMAAALELTEEETQELATAAALHDIGNLRVPEHVIRKAGELTLEERSTIEGHVLLGAIMAFEAGGENVVRGVRHHHEHWDGNGYPSGLKGDKIPLYARVIGIAEAYDAMTSTRPYRQSLTQDQAVAVLRDESGSQFDTQLVETFVDTLPEPLHIVERFPFLAWAQRQIHELRILFRRVGAVALSAAASTIAIALILGTAVIKPDVFDGGGNGTEDERIPRTLAQSGSTNDRVLGERIELAVTNADGTITEYTATTARSTVQHGSTLGGSVEGDVIHGSDPKGQGPGTDGPGGGNGGGNGGGGNGGGNGDNGTSRPDTPDDSQNGGGGDNGGGNGGGPNPTPTPTVKPTTPPGNGGNPTPTPSPTPTDPGTEEDPPGPGKGKGKGRENAPGQNKDKHHGKPDWIHGPGNSGNAPGKNKDHGKPDKDESPGNSGNAPGQDKDKGKPEPTPTPGSTGDFPGSPGGSGNSNAGGNGNGNSDSGSSGGDSPGNSGSSNAGGNGNSGSSDSGSSDSGSSGGDSPGNSGSSNAGGSGNSGSGSSDSGSSDSGSSDSGSSGSSSSPGNSGNSNAGGNGNGNSGSSDSGSSGSSSSPGNSGNSNAGGNGNGKDKDEESPEA